MKSPTVIIPFKAARKKSRLAGALGDSDRRRLSTLMLASVLSAVGRAGLSSGCLVVTSDRGAMAAAEKAGAGVVTEERDQGVNAAVSLGMARSRASMILVVPADLPLLTARDLKEALRLKSSGADVVVSPSRHMDGTNLLLMPSAAPIPLSYDRNSFWNHLGSAASSGFTAAVYTGPGTVLDIDTAEDLELLARSRGGGEPREFARRAMT